MQMETELKPIVLENELIDHLGIAENAQSLYDQRFIPEFLTEEETAGRNILEYQFSHIEKYHEPASREVICHTFNVECIDPSSELNWLIDEFKTRFARGKVENVLTEIAGTLYQKEPHSVIDETIDSLVRIRENIRVNRYSISGSDYQDILDSYYQNAQDRRNQGVTYGFKEVDTALGGLKRGELIYVIGRPKRYKSWMLMKSMVEAQKAGANCVFFTLEMELEETFYRYACMAAGISWPRFKQNELNAHDKDIFNKNMERIIENGNINIIKPPRGERTVQSLKLIAKEHGADIVYVDQLKFLESTKNVAADQRFREIEYINEDLKDACGAFPFYVAAQFNREAAKLSEMADLSKIGLSDSIGQTADAILGLHQTKDMRTSQVVELGIIEARAYETASWEMKVELTQNSNFRITGLT
jgi:replicative DNA helicase